MKTRISNKVQILKNLLKEAVREVIQEELREILREELKNMRPVLENSNSGVKDYRKFLPKQNVVSIPPLMQPSVMNANDLVGNPLAKFIMDAGNNIKGDEFSQIANMNSNNVSMPHNMMDLGEIESYSPPGMPNIGM